MTPWLSMKDIGQAYTRWPQANHGRNGLVFGHVFSIGGGRGDQASDSLAFLEGYLAGFHSKALWPIPVAHVTPMWPCPGGSQPGRAWMVLE